MLCGVMSPRSIRVEDDDEAAAAATAPLFSVEESDGMMRGTDGGGGTNVGKNNNEKGRSMFSYWKKWSENILKKFRSFN